jgi:hypothetical protein
MRTNERQCTAVKTVKTASFYRERFTLGEFFFKGGSVDQNFHFFTKMAGNFYLSIPEVALHHAYAHMSSG